MKKVGDVGLGLLIGFGILILGLALIGLCLVLPVYCAIEAFQTGKPLLLLAGMLPTAMALIVYVGIRAALRVRRNEE